MAKTYNISPEALDALKDFEGCRLTTYRDIGGTLTIGYGHTDGVQEGDRISQWYADFLLQQDVALCEAYVNGLGVTETQGQFDALVDFCYNLGVQRLEGSTLLRKIRQRASTEEIQAEFRRWCYVKGKRNHALEARCKWRAARWGGG